MKIIVFTPLTASSYGKLLSDCFKLRYQEFIERQNYEVFKLSDVKIEFDRYDYPTTFYVAIVGDNHQIVGTARLNFTSLPYMIEEVFPELINNQNIPKSFSILECTRFCVDKKKSSELQEIAKIYLIYAIQVFCLSQKINYLIGVMHPRMWKNLLIRRGVPIEYMGEIKRTYNRRKIVAAKIPVSQGIVLNIQQKYQIKNVLCSDININ